MSVTSSRAGQGNPIDEAVGSREEGDFYPETILKKRTNKRGKDEYLVKWEDRGDEHNSWEPYGTVKEYPDLMRDFENPWINQRKMELVAKKEGRMKRAEKMNGGQSQVMAAPPPPSGSSDSATRGDKGREGRSKKKSKTSMEPSSTSTSPPASISSAELCLLNPVILDNLFKVCSHDLLANCRLVCKTWYRESLVTWRSTSSVIVLHRLWQKDEIYLGKTTDFAKTSRYRHGDSDFEQEDDEPSKTPLSTFLAYLRQECGTKPYRQFYLSNWSFTPPPPTSENSAKDRRKIIQGQQCRFWKLVGGNVTYLKLSACKFPDASAFRKIIFQTCPNLQTLILHNCSCSSLAKSKRKGLTATHYSAPAYGEHVNLRSLSVHHHKNWDPTETQRLPVSPLELLSHFPFLASFNLIYGKLLEYNDADMGDLILWINAIKMIRQHDSHKLALGSFSVGPGFQLGHSIDPAKCRELCSLFQELNLHPELLDVQLHCDVVETLKDVLNLSGKTIRKIRAVKDVENVGCCGRRAIPSSKEFPCKFPFGMELDNLQELTLSAGFCRDMEFMKWTPNLEKLRIIKNDRELGHHGATPDLMVLNTSEAIMADVTLLKLKELWMGYRLHDVEETKRFCDWMPNLEIAAMFVDDEQLGIICENWRNLKHLHVLGSRLGDKGITGMGFKGDGDGSGVAVVRPNIGLLKELTCFQFAKLDSKLSDASIYNGFLNLPNLQTLGIASYKTTIGDEALKAIHEKVPNCQIIGSTAYDRLYGATRLRQRNIRCDYFP